MGFENELIVIKQYQRDFFAKFGKRLPVDFGALKGVELKTKRTGLDEMADDIQDYLYECISKCKANLEIIKSGTRLNGKLYNNEKEALKLFSRKVVENKWNMRYCGSLVNRLREEIKQYSNL